MSSSLLGTALRSGTIDIFITYNINITTIMIILYRNAIEKIVERLHWNINPDNIYCIIISHDGKYDSVRACNKMRDIICSQRFVQTQIELGANGYVTIAGYNDDIVPEFVISYILS